MAPLFLQPRRMQPPYVHKQVPIQQLYCVRHRPHGVSPIYELGTIIDTQLPTVW